MQQDDVPLVSSIAATLLSGLIGSMKNIELSVNDAVYVAERIVDTARERAETGQKCRTMDSNGRIRVSIKERQPTQSPYGDQGFNQH